jgi:hypothetical protein
MGFLSGKLGVFVGYFELGEIGGVLFGLGFGEEISWEGSIFGEFYSF